MVSRTDFDVYLITDRGRILPSTYNGVVKLIPGEKFSIVVTNNTNLKTKVKFYLSGTYVGTLVIPKFQKCELKRPIEGVDRCFIYCEFGTSIAEKARLDPNKPHADELTAIFILNIYQKACRVHPMFLLHVHLKVLVHIKCQNVKQIMEG